MIYLVEDDESIRGLFAKVLGAAGYGVTCCSNLGSAQTLYQVKRPDLILIDGKLPDGNGARWAEQIQAADNQKVLVITGTEDSMTVEVMRKPVRPAALVAKVAELLGNADTPAPPTS